MQNLGMLRMRSVRDADEHVIALAGEFDLVTAGKVERELERVAAGDVTAIVVDLRALTFMDSCGLRTMLAAHQRVGARLSIVPGPRSVQRVFEICGVLRMLPFVEARPRAVAAPSPPVAPLPPVQSDADHAVLSAQIARAAVARRSSQAVLASAIRGLRSHDRHRHLRAVR